MPDLGLKKAGFTQAAIAQEVGVHKPTLSREWLDSHLLDADAELQAETRAGRGGATHQHTFRFNTHLAD